MQFVRSELAELAKRNEVSARMHGCDSERPTREGKKIFIYVRRNAKRVFWKRERNDSTYIKRGTEGPHFSKGNFRDASEESRMDSKIALLHIRRYNLLYCYYASSSDKYVSIRSTEFNVPSFRKNMYLRHQSQGFPLFVTVNSFYKEEDTSELTVRKESRGRGYP